MSILKKNSIVVVEITPDLENSYYRHVRSIARHLRQADIDELAAIKDNVPYDDVMDCYEKSARKWIVIEYDGNVFSGIALFGVQAQENTGIPWMVATDNLKRIKGFMIKNSQKYIDIMKGMFDVLYNAVDKRNIDSIKWLKRFGFQFDELPPTDKLTVPFYKVYLECK